MYKASPLPTKLLLQLLWPQFLLGKLKFLLLSVPVNSTNQEQLWSAGSGLRAVGVRDSWPCLGEYLLPVLIEQGTDPSCARLWGLWLVTTHTALED